MRQGYSILIAGWDASASPGEGRFTIHVPVAKNPDGSPIVGSSMEEFVVDTGNVLTGLLTYTAANLDKSEASLARRIRTEDAPTPVPADGWEYTDGTGKAIRLLPAGTPFKRGALYEFVYQAKDPLVVGLGLAAIRDTAAFFRSAARDSVGTPHPLAGDVRSVTTACVSQPCRTLHDFVYYGFNQDETGKRAVDGVINWVGGATGIYMNYRFAQTGRTHRQHIARRFPEFQFPFANQVLTDPVTGRIDGRFARCLATDTCPKVFEVNSANEYWAKNMAHLHIEGAGKDLPDAPGARAYLMASLPHAGGNPAPGPGIGTIDRNTLAANAVLRAVPAGADDGCDAAGLQHAFKPTKGEREKTGDPRRSIEERYPTQAGYVQAVTAAVQRLQRDRLLLDEDVRLYMKKANEATFVK
jgi:hypothetical protein